MSQNERRLAPRVPISIYVEQHVDDVDHRCFATSLSRTGIYIERISGDFRRPSEEVNLELPLPGRDGALWIKGRVVYDCIDPLFHGTAIEFEWMSREDQKALNAWLSAARRELSLPFSEVVAADCGIHIFRPVPTASLN